MADNKIFDVIIVGGSYAGLSAAMALGRSLRNVLIIDSGEPCNKQTPNSHNFLAHDGAKPFDIVKQGKKQVLKYIQLNLLVELQKKDIRRKTYSSLNLKKVKLSIQKRSCLLLA